MISLQLCWMSWLMLSAYWSSPVDSTCAVWMPNWSPASVWPFSAVWLKPLSSNPPESETMHALKSGLAAATVGAASEVASVGAALDVSSSA